MKIAYFDCIAGASGDMILGALLDAGLPEAVLRQELAVLNLPGFDLKMTYVLKGSLRATKVDLLIEDETTERTLAEILDVLEASQLSDEIRAQAVTICRRMGAVEASIHDQPVATVHLHELGGLDTIVDIVGALIGLHALQIEQVYASPLPMGRGFTRSAHGPLPLPAPATLALLQGVPIRGSDLELELVTPTGAAILSTLAAGFGSIPEMTLISTGYGAGSRDMPIPNILRLLVGESPGFPAPPERQTLVLLESNLDDLNPQVYGYLMERLFQIGALDVFLQSIQMKKNRPATLVSVLCHPSQSDLLSRVLFEETSTLGIRKTAVERQSLRRVVRPVDTPYGSIRIKFAVLPDGQIKSMPEYEDCRKLAAQHHIALREISQAAERAAEEIAVNLTPADFSSGSLDSLGAGE
jgi:uncharacterized protein (TIGR00299 family) protein